jgi:L-aminopeptidase/D-esterase-like protein
MMVADVEPRGRLTQVDGLLVGHWTDTEGITGCTVVLCEEPFVCAADVRGGAPGTRETDLLAPGRLVERVDAIVLAGGSAYGLAAADGVVAWLRDQGRGFPTKAGPVPIVPAAIIYDLWLGKPSWPGAQAGYFAAASASADFTCGSVGAGTGATVGKFLGEERATKAGVGTACLAGVGGLVVGALAVVNALGNVVEPESGRVVAGARLEDGTFASARLLYTIERGWSHSMNTTLVVVGTNAALSRSEAYRVAQMAQDGLALAVRPAHTLYDGDTTFCVATGKLQADPNLVGIMAVEVVAAAIVHAASSAGSLGGIPAARDVRGVQPA